MRLSQRLLALLAPAVLVAACTTVESVHRPLPAASMDKIASTEVVVPILQNDLYMLVPQSNTALILASAIPGVGILGAAVLGGMAGAMDASITSANAGGAQAALKPIRDAMPDFRFDESFQTELSTAIAQAPNLKATQVRVVKEVTNDKMDAALDAATSAAVLFVTTDYQLSQNADTLTISLATSLFPKSAELQALMPAKKTRTSGPKTLIENALYRSIMTYETRAPNATTDRQANVALWAADNGAGMRAAMKQGQATLAQMLAADLQAGPAAAVDPKTTKLPPYKAQVVSGFIMRTDADGGQLIALSNGVQAYKTASMAAQLKSATAAQKAAGKAAAGEPEKLSARERAAQQKEAEKERRAKAKAEKEGN